MITCTSRVSHGDTQLTVTAEGTTFASAFAFAVEATDIGYRPSPPNTEGGLRLLRAHDSGEEVPRQSNYAYYDTAVDGTPVIQIGWCDFTFTSRPVRLWSVQAQVVVQLEEKAWSSSRQVPTFYLDPQVQGITDKAHAERIAEDILSTAGALDDEHVSYVITVEPVY